MGGSGGKFGCCRCSLAKATGCSQLLGNHSCSIFLTFLEMPFISSSVLYQRLSFALSPYLERNISAGAEEKGVEQLCLAITIPPWKTKDKLNFQHRKGLKTQFVADHAPASFHESLSALSALPLYPSLVGILQCYLANSVIIGNSIPPLPVAVSFCTLRFLVAGLELWVAHAGLGSS